MLMIRLVLGEFAFWSRVEGRGSRVTSRGSRVTSRGSKNSSQLFLSVVKSKFHIGPCLLEFPVPVLLSDRCVNQPARLLPFAVTRMSFRDFPLRHEMMGSPERFLSDAVDYL